MKTGGPAFDIDARTAAFNSAPGVAASLLGSRAGETLLAIQPLYTAPASGAILAGVPSMDLQLAPLNALDAAACAAPLRRDTCDPILFFGIGHRKTASQRCDPIDDQLTPVRGYGAHAGRMSGIAERLASGDRLALTIYGFRPQYPLTGSRDLLLPALRVLGSLGLPLLDAADVSSDR